MNNFPNTCGYYILFDEEGNFIYVGKASNLKDIISIHLSKNEINPKIKNFAKYVIYEKTHNINDSEIIEDEIFDDWVRNTGNYPFANRIKPPKSKLTNSEINNIEIKKIVKGILKKKNLF
ncbi:MAG: GIY-YIG nuclease family protein [Candidatus Cloacimonetes bacterium]|nr:GIY-YIG nuclease family protein [Candidatus Cloacimonadota bacterium]